MKKICIIPARGGSKRIPRKNIKLFLGKPIISYSIKAAIQSNLFDEVMVSTEDKEIAKIANLYGAKVPFFRSKKNSSDFSTTYDVIHEVIKEYKKINVEFDHICCLYPTAPLITTSILKEGYNYFSNNSCEYLIPIIEYSHPIQRSYFINNEYLELVFPENKNERTQDMGKTYHDAGQFYWINLRSMIKHKSLFSEKVYGFKISSNRFHDIDTFEDWEVAELKYKMQKIN